MKKVELAVIINSFNRLELLKKSLDSLGSEFSRISMGFSVFIFDAGSTDGSVEWIKKFSDNSNVAVKLIDGSVMPNSSFSYGVNTACSYASEYFKDVKYFFLYETDNFLTSFLPVVHSLKLLEEIPDLAACGYTVKKQNGSPAGFGSSFPSFLSFISGQQLSFFLKLNETNVKWIKNNYCEYSYSDIVYTSPLLLKRSSWEKVNGFDFTNFPFSDCDIDLAYRIMKEGEKMAVVRTDAVVHDNLEIKSSWSSMRALNYYAARFRYFRKHYGFLVHGLKPVLFLMHCLEWSLLFFLLLIGKRNKKALKTRWMLIKSVFINYQLN